MIELGEIYFFCTETPQGGNAMVFRCGALYNGGRWMLKVFSSTNDGVGNAKA